MQHIKIPIIVYSPVFIYFWLEKTLQFFFYFFPTLFSTKFTANYQWKLPSKSVVFSEIHAVIEHLCSVGEYLSVWWCQRLVLYRSAAFVSLTVFKCGPALGAVRFDICGPEVNRGQVCDPIVSMGPGLLLSFSVY